MQITARGLAESLNSLSDPAFVVNEDGRIIEWNRSSETVLGHTRTRVLREPCHEILCGKDALGEGVCKRECLVFRNIRAGNPARRFRMHVRTEAGHHVQTECTTLHMRGTDGELLVFHLLRLWPGSAQEAADWPRRHRGRKSPRSIPPMTKREREVLELLAAGASTREMTDALGIATATVRTHVDNILFKLKAHSRLEAVAIALQEGLV